MLEVFEKKKYILWIFVFLLFGFFTKKIIKNFDGPIFGYSDTNNWEHTGYFLYKYLSFHPLPKIQFLNNGTLFPFGANHVFQSWNLEKDFFWIVFFQFFGNGPWLKIYYFLSVLFVFLGSYAILQRFFSHTKSFITSLLLTFFNFYTILKYPYHLVYSDTHWVILSLVLDFLILWNYVYDSKIDFFLILLRLCTLSFGFGSELGYIVGLNFTSFLITYLIFFMYLVLDKKLDLLFQIKDYFKKNKKFSICIVTISSIVLFFYLSLILEIMKNVYSFDLKEIPEGVWWSNPLRIFLPFFPGIVSSKNLLESIFFDTPDGLGSGSIGWTLLGLGILGLFHSRKKVRIFIPFLVILFLLWIYHPEHFPILKIFPWFKYMRVSGRGTLIFPAIFVLFSLGIDWSRFSLRMLKFVLIACILLGTVELNHAYGLRISIDSKLSKEFYSYMEKIKNTKGEAVLDWPFCIYGANLDTGLCPFYPQTVGVYSFSKFHQKKVIGQYYGRVHPSQVEPFIRYGLKDLFLYDSNSNPLFPSQKRCFNEVEWKKFDDFFSSYDFSGINLHVDIVGEKCKLEFYKRYGHPIGKVEIPYSGHLEFIQKK